jgi:hypothetical protein
MMNQRVRRMVTACVAVVALLALPAAATAAPAGESLHGLAWNPVQLVHEMVSWLGGWLDESPIQSVSAPGGHSMDPNGSPSPDPGAGGTVTTQGGHTMDPDG